MEKIVQAYKMAISNLIANGSPYEIFAYFLGVVLAISVMILCMRLFQLTDNLYDKIGKQKTTLARISLVVMMISAFFHGVDFHVPQVHELVFIVGFALFLLEINILAYKYMRTAENIYLEIAEQLRHESIVGEAAIREKQAQTTKRKVSIPYPTLLASEPKATYGVQEIEEFKSKSSAAASVIAAKTFEVFKKGDLLKENTKK